jgi:hypothetical protein
MKLDLFFPFLKSTVILEPLPLLLYQYLSTKKYQKNNVFFLTKMWIDYMMFTKVTV